MNFNLDIEQIKKIGIIGAGIMGHGIAQIFAQQDYQTMLYSRKEETLSGALKKIESNLERFAKHRIIPNGNIKRAVSRIQTSTELKNSVEDVDFVVEATSEDMNVKKSVFKSLDAFCPEHTILTTNTSGLSITEISSATNRPEKVVGTHFWNPPYLVPLVEVTKGNSTSDEAFQITYELMERIGKAPVKVLKDIPGFIGNRIQHAMYREIFSLLDQKIATPEDIDKTVTLSFGGRLSVLGPLAIADLNGVDLFYEVQKYLLRKIEHSPEPVGLLRDMVERGNLGTKVGKGFYSWDKKKIEEVTERRDTGLMNVFAPYLKHTA